MPKLLIIGNLIGRNSGFVTTQGQIVSDRFSADGYEVNEASSRLNILLRLLDVIWTILRKGFASDLLIVEVYSGKAFFLADVASGLAKILRIPSILFLHGGDLPVFEKKHPRWVRRVLRRARAIAAPSSFLAKEMADIGFEIRVIPNVIELETYPFRLRSNVEPRLLWMRSFHDIYNPQLALDSYAIVRRRFPEASLVMAGVDKGLEGEIKRSADDMGLGNSVRFPGFLDQEKKIEEFSKADVFVNTNRIDNMPVSVVEACAMGLPVVATRVGGLPDLIEHGSSGLLVDAEDARAMADAIVELVDDKELAAGISRKARLTAEKSGWSNVRALWEALFEEILPGEGKERFARESGHLARR